jgi:prephenate dehydrogenase
VVAVIGLGLVGGSLARALTRAGHRVIGVDRASVRRRALASRAVAQAMADPRAAAAAADVVFLAAPPRANRALLRRLAGDDGVVLTDVSSVKAGIVADARRLGLRRFVGGHPIAGAEGAGFAASSPDLFRGQAWVLVPGRDRRAFRAVRALVLSVGARPVALSAAEHDRVLSFLSHLPQVVAWALMETALGDGATVRRLSLAGPGFRDMTRLARSPRALWREILAENEREVHRALEAFRSRLGSRRGGRYHPR